MAMDYVWDSASILTSFREELSKFGVIFCSISEAIKEYPDLVRQHLGSVVSTHIKVCTHFAPVYLGFALSAADRSACCTFKGYCTHCASVICRS